MTKESKIFNFSAKAIKKAHLDDNSLSELTVRQWRRQENPQWRTNTIIIANVFFLKREKFKNPEKENEPSEQMIDRPQRW